MKNTLKLAVLALLVFTVQITYAHDATVTIDTIGGVTVVPPDLPIAVPYLPYTLMVEGTVTHVGEGNLRQLLFSAQDNGVYFFNPTRLFSGSGRATVGTYSIPWTITSEGQHVLTIGATHTSRISHEESDEHEGRMCSFEKDSKDVDDRKGTNSKTSASRITNRLVPAGSTSLNFSKNVTVVLKQRQ